MLVCSPSHTLPPRSSNYNRGVFHYGTLPEKGLVNTILAKITWDTKKQKKTKKNKKKQLTEMSKNDRSGMSED